MKELRIHSENNDFQHVETLKKNRTKRQKAREFFVEGVRNINQALAASLRIRAFYSAVDAPLSGWAREVLEREVAERHYLLPPALMAKLSDKHEPSELVAVVAMPEDDLGRIPTPAGARLVVVDRPSNPGNLGTLLRSCDAFQVSGVVMTGHACDLYEPQVLRASMGSFFALPVVRLPSHNDLTAWITRLRSEPEGLSIVGTSANAEQELAGEAFAGRCLVLFGNETSGLSAAYRQLCDRIVKIPMGGSASSLNISCAASIVLYEAFRRR
jgi:TrmH family RNA methyltransferase